MSQNQAAKAFHISRSTINLWCQRQASTGDCKAKPNLPQGNGHKITDWEKFREFVKVNGEKTQVVIADNATFHKGGQIQSLIEAAGCQLQYLPPYSPDLNKIERCWSWLKSRIRKQIAHFDCLRDAIESVLSVVS
jgi:DDE superfamily endonuclease